MFPGVFEHLLYQYTSAILSVAFLIFNGLFAVIYDPKKVIGIKGSPDYTFTDITVLIPVYNEVEDIFRKVIKSVSSMGLKFVVVGDGINQPYRAITEQNGGIFIQLKERRGKRFALSEGMRYIDTSLVLLLDSDTFIDKKSLERMLSYMTEDVGGVSPSIRVWNNGNISYYYANFYEIMSEIVNRATSYFGRTIILSGQCVLYKTSAIRNYVMSDDFTSSKIFNISLKISDDRDLTEYIIEKGYKAIKAIDAIAYTKPPENLSQFVKQVVRWTRANYLFFIRSLRDGSLNLRGNLYVFDTIYMNLLPILVVFSLVPLQYPHFDVFSMLSDSFTSLERLNIVQLILGVPIRAHLPPFNFVLVFILPRVLSIIGSVTFLLVMIKIMEKERGKTLMYGIIALIVQSLASFYSIASIWKQSWSSREKNRKSKK
ncbi:hypothetical protein SUSAZ_00635 [Sulfolobus acidocaldarius SUSAZ]|nr:hypothetical protein SUSAZ_00635 [Sulfolobus acidocaldarius SUSAZ]